MNPLRRLLAQHIADTTPPERRQTRMSAAFVLIGWLGLVVFFVARGCG